MSDNQKTKRILINSIADFVNAKSYQNSIKRLMSSDDKKITALMIMKYLQITSKEMIFMEKDLMDRIKQALVKNEKM